MVAPDGEWGWVVVVGVGVTFAVTTGPVSCFGLVYDQWLRETGADTSDFTFLSGLYLALSFMPGVLARPLLRLFSCRQVGVVGAALCALGCTSAALCRSVASLVVAYSVLQGMGMGLLLPAAFTSLNRYFRRRRTLAVAAAQLLAAAGAALYPALVHALLRHYGFRGTQAILGALSLHALAGAAAMRPLASRRLSRGATLVSRAGAPLEVHRKHDAADADAADAQDSAPLIPTATTPAASPDPATSSVPNHLPSSQPSPAHSTPSSSSTTPAPSPVPARPAEPPLPPPPASFPSDDNPPIEEESDQDKKRNYSNAPRPVIGEGHAVVDPAASPYFGLSLSPPPRVSPPAADASTPPAFRKVYPRPLSALGDASAPGERRRAPTAHRPRSGARAPPDAARSTPDTNRRHEQGERHRRPRRSQRPAVSFDARPTVIGGGDGGGGGGGEGGGDDAGEDTPTRMQVVLPPQLLGRGRLKQRRPTGPFLYSPRSQAWRDAPTGSDTDDPWSSSPPAAAVASSRGSLPPGPLRGLRRVSVILLARDEHASASGDDDDGDEVDDEDDVDVRPPPALRQRKQSMAAAAAGAAAALVASDWALLRSRAFAVVALGAAMAVFSDGMWVALVPLHAATLGLGPGAGARLVAAGSVGDVVGRAALVAGARWAQGRARLVFLASCVLALPLRCGYAAGAGGAGALLALAGALGVLRACRQVALPLLFAERFPPTRFPATFGLFLLIAGLAHLLLGPFVGLVRDASGSYPACLGALTALLLLCVVPWAVEMALYPPPHVRPELLSLA